MAEIDHHITLPQGVTGEPLIVPGRPDLIDMKPLEFEYHDGENIILVGLRGSGKTRVGNVLAEGMGYQFIDLDPELERKYNQTIPEMIAISQDYFREKESELANSILSGRKNEHLVAATGGGIVVRMRENFKAIVRNGVVVYLRTQPETCLSRTGDDPNRPRLNDNGTRLDELKDQYDVRDPLYDWVKDITVDTDGKTPEEIAYFVMRTLNKHRVQRPTQDHYR